jgi:hypothetical protein
VFLMCGKLTFIWFSKSVVQASRSMVDAARGIIGKIDLPKVAVSPWPRCRRGCYQAELQYFALLLVFLLVQRPRATVCVAVAASADSSVNYADDRRRERLSVPTWSAWCSTSRLLITLAMTFLLFTSGIFWDARSLAGSGHDRLGTDPQPRGVHDRCLPAGADERTPVPDIAQARCGWVSVLRCCARRCRDARHHARLQPVHIALKAITS